MICPYQGVLRTHDDISLTRKISQTSRREHQLTAAVLIKNDAKSDKSLNQ